MIQRKQTVYLFLAFICITLILFFPIFTIETVQNGVTQTGEFTAYGFQTDEGQVESFPLYLLFISMALISAMGVFLYKNRKRQLLVCRLNLIFHILVTVAFAVFFYIGQGIIVDYTAADSSDQVSFGVGVGFFLLVASIPFILLAIRGIKHDENLLKSIDRIR